MARARATDSSVHEGDLRGAAAAAPRSTTPLKLVEAAIAGEDLQGVVRAAALALSCTVAIALPSLGVSAHWPLAGSSTEALAALERYAGELVGDPTSAAPAELLPQVVPVRLGQELMGVAAALPQNGAAVAGDARSWLDAAAAAAAITALMRRGSDGHALQARRSFLEMLEAHAQVEADTLLAEAHRLGYDFSQGAYAVSAALPHGAAFDQAGAPDGALVAEVGEQRLLGLVPIAAEAAADSVAQLLEELRAAGLQAVATAPRLGSTGVQEALHEAGVLLELMTDESALFGAHEETYRLLVGVLIRNPEELATLRRSTVAALEDYDATHDTELVATLERFLAHHGSTTDTAEAMQLHRHTVGYRLARVHEVSGLSPYESEGRERLSLGLKAKRIVLAEQRRTARLQRGGGPAGPGARGWRASEPPAPAPS